MRPMLPSPPWGTPVASRNALSIGRRGPRWSPSRHRRAISSDRRAAMSVHWTRCGRARPCAPRRRGCAGPRRRVRRRRRRAARWPRRPPWPRGGCQQGGDSRRRPSPRCDLPGAHPRRGNRRRSRRTRAGRAPGSRGCGCAGLALRADARRAVRGGVGGRRRGPCARGAGDGPEFSVASSARNLARRSPPRAGRARGSRRFRLRGRSGRTERVAADAPGAPRTARTVTRVRGSRARGVTARRSARSTPRMPRRPS